MAVLICGHSPASHDCTQYVLNSASSLGLARFLEVSRSAVVRGGVYHATPEELQAIDEADLSGVASDAEVQTAFATFHRR